MLHPPVREGSPKIYELVVIVFVRLDATSMRPHFNGSKFSLTVV